MKSSELLRHQMIEGLMAQHSEKAAEVSIDLWQQMATQIITIVGEAGFNSLYTRSVFLVQPRFSWLEAIQTPGRSDHRFAQLEANFTGRTPAQIRTANCLLLITFTDILASLIGEPLTTGILRSAWGHHVLE